MAQSKAGCSSCGYDLAGNTSGVCPECGKPIVRFTDRARAVIVEANRHACSYYRNGNPPRPAKSLLLSIFSREKISPSHILLGITSASRGVAYSAMESCGTDIEQLRRTVVGLLPRCTPRVVPDGIKLPLSLASKDTVNVAIEEAAQLGHNWVGTEHLLLALCRNPSDNAVQCALAEANVTSDRVRAFVIANMARVNAPETQ